MPTSTQSTSGTPEEITTVEDVSGADVSEQVEADVARSIAVINQPGTVPVLRDTPEKLVARAILARKTLAALTSVGTLETASPDRWQPVDVEITPTHFRVSSIRDHVVVRASSALAEKNVGLLGSVCFVIGHWQLARIARAGHENYIAIDVMEDKDGIFLHLRYTDADGVPVNASDINLRVSRSEPSSTLTGPRSKYCETTHTRALSDGVRICRSLFPQRPPANSVIELSQGYLCGGTEAGVLSIGIDLAAPIDVAFPASAAPKLALALSHMRGCEIFEAPKSLIFSGDVIEIAVTADSASQTKQVLDVVQTADECGDASVGLQRFALNQHLVASIAEHMLRRRGPSTDKTPPTRIQPTLVSFVEADGAGALEIELGKRPDAARVVGAWMTYTPTAPSRHEKPGLWGVIDGQVLGRIGAALLRVAEDDELHFSHCEAARNQFLRVSLPTRKLNLYLPYLNMDDARFRNINFETSAA